MRKIITAGVAFCLTFLSVFIFGCTYFSRSYTIMFNANGGEGVMEDFYADFSDDARMGELMPKCTFTKEGFESLCWSFDSESDIPVNALWDIRVKDYAKKKKVELFAVWSTPGFEFKWIPLDARNYGVIGYNGSATDIIMPLMYGNNYAKITEQIFKNREDITSVANLSNFFSSLFSGCTSLKTVELRKNENDYYSIYSETFYDCISLENFELPEGIKIIEKKSFYNCVSLKKLIIPESVTDIEEEAFFGWTEDQTIEFLGQTKNVFGEDWLKGCNANIVWAN